MTLNASMFKDDDFEVDLVAHSSRSKKPLFEGVECEDSLYLFSKKSFLRMVIYRIVTAHEFENVILRKKDPLFIGSLHRDVVAQVGRGHLLGKCSVCSGSFQYD
jgi:hypothetical protein